MSVFFRKLSKLIRGLGLIIQKPSLLNVLIDEQDRHAAAVKKLTHSSAGLPEVDFFSLTDDVMNVEPFAFLAGGSLPTDIALLKALAAKIQAQSYFEIGTWRGESVANLAEIVPNCYTLHLGEKEMLRREWNKDYIHLHEYFSNKNEKITHLHGDSRTFDFGPFYGKMDLVFVDGDHHFDTIVQDTRNAFKLLRNENAMIVWHDYGNQPEDIRWNIAHAILEGTPADKRSSLFAISHTLCAAFLPFKVESVNRKYPRVPDPYFSIELKKKSI